MQKILLPIFLHEDPSSGTRTEER